MKVVRSADGKMDPVRRFAWKSWQPIRGGKRATEVHWELLLEPQNGATRVTQRSHWIPKHSMSDPTMLEDNIARGVAEETRHIEDMMGLMQQLGVA